MTSLDKIFLFNKYLNTKGAKHSKKGRVDESNSFLLLKKLYYPLGMKYRGTRCHCVAVERDFKGGKLMLILRK